MPLSLLHPDVLFKTKNEEIFHDVTFHHPSRFHFLENIFLLKANELHLPESPEWFLYVFAIFWSLRSDEKILEQDGPILERIEAFIQDRYVQLVTGVSTKGVQAIAQFVGKIIVKENELILAEMAKSEGVQSGKGKPKRLKTKSKALI